jgi:hypothetical protein
VLNLLALGLVVAKHKYGCVWREGGLFQCGKERRRKKAVCSVLARDVNKYAKLKCASHSSEWSASRGFLLVSPNGTVRLEWCSTLLISRRLLLPSSRDGSPYGSK